MQDLSPLFAQAGEILLEIARVLKKESQQNDREQQLIDEHGEIVTKTRAMTILHKGHAKVTQMLEDGRLDPVCEGTMVCVRSIARYMQNPKKENWDAKIAARRKAVRPVQRRQPTKEAL